MSEYTVHLYECQSTKFLLRCWYANLPQKLLSACVPPSSQLSPAASELSSKPSSKFCPQIWSEHMRNEYSKRTLSKKQERPLFKMFLNTLIKLDISESKNSELQLGFDKCCPIYTTYELILYVYIYIRTHIRKSPSKDIHCERETPKLDYNKKYNKK